MQMCDNRAVREITNQVQKDMLIKEDTDMAKTRGLSITGSEAANSMGSVQHWFSANGLI